MRNLLGPNTVAGYCTNVHAGNSFAATLANLEKHSVAVKRHVCPNEPMGVGVWLASNAADQIIKDDRIGEFKDWLGSRGLLAYTLNGFPYGNFHDTVVKHRVYHPEWCDAARLQYTMDLATILAGILPDGVKEGSISTLPIGWRESIQAVHDKSFRAAQDLVALTEFLEKLEGETGKLIHIDLEPEPGCYLDTSQDVVDFFNDEMKLIGNDVLLHRYLRVCHDICHAAVMFESQTEALDNYRQAGIEVGKIQVSSAVSAPFDKLDEHDRITAFKQLHAFGEDRYLHQTMAKTAGSHFYEDLPKALAEFEGAPPPTTEWRVHFHVPLFLERFGLLETTREDVLDCLTIARAKTNCLHYEVETYAWGVLPDELRAHDLSLGIADELSWLQEQAEKLAPVV